MVRKISAPPPVLEAIAALEQNKYEAWCVGGCVRDSLMDATPKDWDVATAATPDEIKRVFEGGRVLETGIKHGTVTALIGGMPIEITTFRDDGDYVGHRRPRSVTFARDVLGDLGRRDFTINAMAYHPERGLLDPHGGRDDIAGRTLRCVGDAGLRFEEDALRILRCLRFASTLCFDVEAGTRKAIYDKAGLLGFISAERIAVEMSGILRGRCCARTLMDYQPVFWLLFPFLSGRAGGDWADTCRALGYADLSPAGKYALFFGEDGLVRQGCARLKLDGATSRAARKIAARAAERLPGDAPGLRRLLRALGPEGCSDVIEIKRVRGDAGAVAAKALLSDIIGRGDCVSLDRLAVDGRDLARMGVTLDRRMGDMLETLLGMVMDGRCPNDRDSLLLAARGIWATWEDRDGQG